MLRKQQLAVSLFLLTGCLLSLTLLSAIPQAT